MLKFIRNFSVSSKAFAPDKYYKITRYAKPVPKTDYKVGDVIPATQKVTIPPNKRSYPIYQYETLFFKQQNKGLYGGLQRSSGHTCSESGNKHLRSRRPNVVTASVYSEVLNKVFKLKISTRVLKIIDKEGGLDKYVLKDKPARVKTMGKLAWRIRYDILKKMENNDLPVINGSKVLTTYKDYQIIVGKKKLLALLQPYVQKDSYYPVDKKQFLSQYSWMNSNELCEQLDKYGFEFSQVSA